MKRRFGWLILLIITHSVAAQELAVESPDVPAAPEATSSASDASPEPSASPALTDTPESATPSPSPEVVLPPVPSPSPLESPVPSPIPSPLPSPSATPKATPNPKATPAASPKATPIVSPQLQVQQTDEIRYPDAKAVLNPATATPSPKPTVKPTPTSSTAPKAVSTPSTTKPILLSKPAPLSKPTAVKPTPTASTAAKTESWYWAMTLEGTEADFKTKMDELSQSHPSWSFRLQKTESENRWKVLTGPSSEITLPQLLQIWGTNAPVNLERLTP